MALGGALEAERVATTITTVKTAARRTRTASGMPTTSQMLSETRETGETGQQLQRRGRLEDSSVSAETRAIAGFCLC